MSIIKELVGKYKHYCYEWDGLEIDETCDEIACCGCFDDEKFKEVRSFWQRKHDEFNEK